MEISSHYRQLLRELNEQRQHGILCDACVIVDGKIFKAHKNVLLGSSRYFKTLYCQVSNCFTKAPYSEKDNITINLLLKKAATFSNISIKHSSSHTLCGNACEAGHHECHHRGFGCGCSSSERVVLNEFSPEERRENSQMSHRSLKKLHAIMKKTCIARTRQQVATRAARYSEYVRSAINILYAAMVINTNCLIRQYRSLFALGLPLM